MEVREDSFAEALQKEHTDLLRDLHELESAIGSGSREGPAEIVTRLGQVRTHLANHFRFEEQGGYMAPVLKEEPRFGRVIQELLAEHGKIAQALDELIYEVSRAQSWEVVPLEKIRVWIGQVRHHEACENNLVQEAYYSSGATGD
jgi:hypothetical protein